MIGVSLVLLALALSLDSLTVGLLYGMRGIRLSWTAMAIVSLATGVLLSLAMAGGQVAGSLLPPLLAQRLGAILLTGVGVWITYQTWRNHRQGRPAAGKQEQPLRRVWHLRLGSVGIVVEILREPALADLDRSGHINPTEAFFLGIALALDSVAAGLGAALSGYSPYGLPLAAMCGSLAMMYLGSRGAKLLPIKLYGRWEMVHGIMLVVLGLYRMVI